MHKVDRAVLDALRKHRLESDLAGAFSGPDQEIPVILRALAEQDQAEVAIAYHNHLIRMMGAPAEPVVPEAPKARGRKPKGAK